MAVLLISAILLAGSNGEELRLKKIDDTLRNYTEKFPQHKAYLHIDKSFYYTDDIIWFKAYLLNGLHHTPQLLSTNLYAELISPAGQQVQIIRVQMKYGFGYGDFKLSDTLPEGLYQIRAYTNWMLNFHPDFFFSRNIQIYNPGYKKLISPKQARKNRKILNRKDNIVADIDVQFFPEGGYMVSGIESKIAFKAIDKTGKSIFIEGSLYDSDKNKINTFSTLHEGMGMFRLKPQKGKKYYALVTYGNKEYRINLPEPLEYGIIMDIEDNKEDINIKLTANKLPTNDRVANEVIVIGQVRGKIYYQSVENIASGSSDITLKKNIFPSGIVQFTLFSGRMVPLAERLVFVNHNDFMRININAYDTITDNNEHLLALSITTRDKFKKPLKSNLSMAVLYDNANEMIMPDNIVSNLMLTSDLKGYIQNPGYFLQNSLDDSDAMELLMLTHGWRRFDWSEMLKGKYPKINYYEEKGITIAGMITSELFSIPLKDCKVQLTVKEAYNDVFVQQSDARGIFVFDNLLYFDTINVKIEAWRPSGRRNLVIVVPDDQLPEVTKLQGEPVLTTVSERDNKAYRREKLIKEKLAYEEEQRRIAAEDSNKLHGIHGQPDYVIRSEDIPYGYRDALQVIQGRVPGVTVNGNNVYIRGISTIYGDTQPLFLVDNIPVSDVNAILSIPVEDIERIEIIKGPTSSIYGVRGGNGVIAIYTKRGQFMKKGIIEFQMLGYHYPRKFYQPAFAAGNKPEKMTTILWQPVIETNIEGKSTVLLKKPRIDGNFRVIIEGISLNGKPGYANFSFENN
jgi:TonB-dependent SusC/RagA subfamily outer membrane receptor